MCSFNYFRFSFAKCEDPQIVVVRLAYKEELGEGRGGGETNRRLVQV